MPFPIVRLARAELRFAPRPWPFALARRAEIDAHFAGLSRDNPHAFNGRVLMLHDVTHHVAAIFQRNSVAGTELIEWLRGIVLKTAPTAASAN